MANNKGNKAPATAAQNESRTFWVQFNQPTADTFSLRVFSSLFGSIALLRQLVKALFDHLLRWMPVSKSVLLNGRMN
ncbi:MAG: hypothetical protein DSM106950_03980 [Stigonema ocellatum SAG 48.90 = DSM 106950]|nr:hypothetical protein [Stigonema ocellatum SAG 48.90 = DSM 106950]